MGVTIKKNFNFKKQLKGAASKSSREIKKEIVGTIIAEYEKGSSPVKGFNRFKPYRKSTAKRKGRRSPVNLKQSGAFHRSLTAIQSGKRRIRLFFKGTRNDEIATYHQFGTDHMDARPVLPSRGQAFKKRILERFNKIITKALNGTFK